MIKAGGGNL